MSESVAKKRLRFGTFPAPTDGKVPYAKLRSAHKGETEAEWTLALISSPAWQEVMVPVLDEVEAGRSSRGRHAHQRYTSHEFETVLIFGKVHGCTSYKETRRLLASDEHRRTRRLLGLTRSRGGATWGDPERARLEGIPSESSMSRHLDRFPEATRALVYEALAQRLREQAAPMFDEDASVMYIDGTFVLTRYTPPKYRRDGTLTNADRVTAPEAGYRNNRRSDAEKNGQGWTLVMLVDQAGMCWGHEIIKLHEDERLGAVSVLDRYQAKIGPHLSQRVRVLVADAGFSGDRVRNAARDAGLIEVCHPVSHAARDQSRRRAAQYNEIRFAIEGYPKWHANGHREIGCECGHASLTRRAWLDKQGKAKVRVEGSCRNCGSITITSGQWRRAQNPDRFVKILPSETNERPDYLFGNPLTFNDRLASIYGSDRFGRDEGFHGTLATRFKLIQHPRWLRTLDQVRTEAAIVLCITLALGIRHRMSSGPPLAEAPPGVPLAA